MPGWFPCQSTSQCPNREEHIISSAFGFGWVNYYTSISNVSIEIYVKFRNKCETFHQRLGNKKLRSYLKAFYKRYLNVCKTTFIYKRCNNVPKRSYTT